MPRDVLWGAVQRVCAPESWGPLIRAVAIAETDLPPERRQYKVMATIDSKRCKVPRRPNSCRRWCRRASPCSSASM